MAARSLSTRVCRQCRRSEAELAQRRFASSLAGPADEQVQQHEQQSPETAAAATATASSPVTSTSTDNTADATQLLSKLRFEIYQAKPVRQQVWVRLHQLYAVSPSFSGHPSILQSTIRILSGHSGIPKTAKGSGRIIAIQEEAEALYARYRFISNRMLETGTWEQNNLVNPKKNDRIFLTWLKGIQELGYGPAAWRIWADFRSTTSVENPSPLTAPIAHSVLVATMQWLIEQRDRGLDTDSFNAQSTQCLQQAKEVVAFLEETNTHDWIARSIMVRILKEAERKQEYLQMLKDNYNFDPATPSLIPFDAEAGRPGLAPARKLDVHTLNTVMNHFKQTDDLSKMVSLFETATAPAPHKAKELKDASDVPFFHSNSDGDLPIYSFVTGEAIPQPRRETKTRSSAMQPVPAATHPSGQSVSNTPSEKLRFTLPSEPFTLTNVNAYTIGLLIREATRLGHIHLAFHYTKQAHALWEQERTRLRKACQKLHDLQRKQISRLTQEQMLDLLPTQVAASRVSMSVHTMQPLYEMAKKGANGSGDRHRHVLVFRACMELAYQIVETLKRDTVFWARVCDNMEEVRAALDDLSRRAYHSRVSDREGLADYREKKLDLKTHLLLQTRLKLEMNALANKLDIATTDVLAYKKAHAIMNELKVEKLAPAEMSGATEKQLSTFISQMQKRVKKARNWTLKDTLQDAWRLQLTRKLGKSLSTRQLSRLLRARGEKYQRRRAKVRVAIVKAQDAIKAAMVARTDLREAAELQAKAEVDLDAQKKAEAEASMQQVAEAQTANESAKEHGNVTIQAASQYGSPALILC